jgi:hypothetical protein
MDTNSKVEDVSYSMTISYEKTHLFPELETLPEAEQKIHDFCSGAPVFLHQRRKESENVYFYFSESLCLLNYFPIWFRMCIPVWNTSRPIPWLEMLK